MLKEKNIGVAIFIDHWGVKMEGSLVLFYFFSTIKTIIFSAYNATVFAGKIFEEAGVTFAVKFFFWFLNVS